MLDLTFIQQYCVPLVLGICLCVGYIIKTSIPSIPNNLIPLIISVIGLMVNVWINMNISPEIVLGGMFSGLASTGTYEMFRNLISKK